MTRTIVATPATHIPTTTRPTPHHTIRTITHHCPTRHRTDTTQARHIWPHAAWITGTGPWATLAWCNTLTAKLWPTETAARLALRIIDNTACGQRCTNNHELGYIL